MSEQLLARELGPCPICGQSLAKPISSCSECHTPHHAECWTYNEGCAIYGCGAKPAAPPPPAPSAMARVMPRLSATVLLLSLFTLFAIGGRSFNVRMDELGIEAKGRTTAASWMTTPRSRCVLEVVRADQPDVVLYRRHSPRAHYHRLDLPFVKAGETYLVRVTTQSGFFSGETISQLYRAPEAETRSLDAIANAAAALPPRRLGNDLLAAATSAINSPAMRRAQQLAANFGTPRDPFRQLTSGGIRTRIRHEGVSAPWMGFDMTMSQRSGQMMWRTRTPLSFCRVVVLRDSALKGVEKVVDATNRNGFTHNARIEGLEPDTSYQMLVLGFPESGDPIQSPVLSFRTLP